VRVSVECYAGHRGDETPLRIRFGERLVEIIEVLDPGWPRTIGTSKCGRSTEFTSCGTSTSRRR
jgi:hypothetical protein